MADLPLPGVRKMAEPVWSTRLQTFLTVLDLGIGLGLGSEPHVVGRLESTCIAETCNFCAACPPSGKRRFLTELFDLLTQQMVESANNVSFQRSVAVSSVVSAFAFRRLPMKPTRKAYRNAASLFAQPH